MGEHIGIEFTAVNDNYLEGRMPVDKRTRQPLGMLNGGASAALAETIGSMAAYLSIDRDQYYCLGLEIKCNHLRPALDGYVYARATPIHLGRKTHLWQIEIRNEDGQLTAFATLTMAVLELTNEMRMKYSDLFLR
jgi:1,4-dihydroxy-2-naphthoyl-CoA hydrolase